MPEWLRQVLIALGAFLGGQIVTTYKENVERSRTLHRSVDKLTDAVLHLGEDLRGIREEIKTHKQEQDERIERIEDRVEQNNRRIDSFISNNEKHVYTSRIPNRLAYEQGCIPIPGSPGHQQQPPNL